MGEPLASSFPPNVTRASLPLLGRSTLCPPRAKRGGASGVVTAFVVFLILANLFYCYRYLLQINSSLTSPTYQDTPFVFQLAKYAMVPVGLALMGLALLWAGGSSYKIPSSRARLFFGGLLGFVTYLCCIAIYAVALGTPIDHLLVINAFFILPPLLLLPLGLRTWRDTQRIEWALVSFGLVYHTVFQAVQLLLYVTQRRLPALAFDGAIVRFGAGWDDPNGFGAYLCLIVPVVLLSRPWHWLAKAIGLAAAAFMLFLTLSFSAWVGMAATLFALATLKGRLLLFAGCVAGGIGLMLTVPAITDWVQRQVEVKSDSARMRLEDNTFTEFLENAPLTAALFGDHERVWIERGSRPNENTYLEITIGFGVLATLAFILLLAWTMIEALNKIFLLRRTGHLGAADQLIAWVSFVFGFAVLCNFVPNYNVFPVNLYFWTIVFLIWLYPMPPEAEGGARPPTRAG